MSMLSRVRDVLSIVETGSLVSDDELEAKLAAKAPLLHGHTIEQVSGLQAALDDKVSQETHLTDYNTLASNDAKLNSNLQSLILAEQDSWNRAGQDISALQAQAQTLETTKADAIGGVLTGAVLADALLGELQDAPVQTRNNSATTFGYYGTLAALGCSGASVYPTQLTLWRRQNANPASGATPLYLRILRIVNGAWAIAYQSENAVRMNDYTSQDVPMGPWQMKNVDGLGAIPASEVIAIVAVDSLTSVATASIQFGARTTPISGSITSALTASTNISPAAYTPAIQVRFVVAGSEVASRADVADATARAQAQDQIILTRLESKAESNHTHTLEGVTGLTEALATKQDTLTAGENITIENGVIRAAGGGAYTLPVASASTLGGVRVGGAGIKIVGEQLALNHRTNHSGLAYEGNEVYVQTSTTEHPATGTTAPVATDTAGKLCVPNATTTSKGGVQLASGLEDTGETSVPTATLVKTDVDALDSRIPWSSYTMPYYYWKTGRDAHFNGQSVYGLNKLVATTLYEGRVSGTSTDAKPLSEIYATLEALSAKQDVLTAGENITIEDGVIRATGSAASVTAGTGLSMSETGKISLQVAGSRTNGHGRIGGIYTSSLSGADIDASGQLLIKFPQPTAYSEGYPAVFRIPDGDLTVGQVFIYPGGGPEMGKYVCLSDVSSMDLQTRVGNLETQMANKQATLVFDDSPTAESTNPVTSAGIKAYVDTVLGDIDTVLESI